MDQAEIKYIDNSEDTLVSESSDVTSVNYKLGGHCPCPEDSTLSETIIRFKSLNWSCFQVFLGPDDDMFNRRKLSTKDTKLCIEECGMNNEHFRVYTHFPYRMSLVKPSSESKLKGLQDELNTLSKFGGRIVIHPNSFGSIQNRANIDKESSAYVKQYKTGIETMMTNLKMLEFHGDYSLLLEPPASEGAKIGGSFTQIKYITKQLKKNKLDRKVGFCIDTCHSFCAGLSKFNTPKAVDKFFNKLEKLGTLPHIKCVHLNDSKEPFKAMKDRHELLCLGKIWKGKEDGFIAFVRKCAALNIDIICETNAPHGVPLCFAALAPDDEDDISEI